MSRGTAMLLAPHATHLHPVLFAHTADIAAVVFVCIFFACWSMWLLNTGRSR